MKNQGSLGAQMTETLKMEIDERNILDSYNTMKLMEIFKYRVYKVVKQIGQLEKNVEMGGNVLVMMRDVIYFGQGLYIHWGGGYLGFSV